MHHLGQCWLLLDIPPPTTLQAQKKLGFEFEFEFEFELKAGLSISTGTLKLNFLFKKDSKDSFHAVGGPFSF